MTFVMQLVNYKSRDTFLVGASSAKKLLHPFGFVTQSRNQDRVNYD